MQEEYKPAAIYSPISIGNWIISLILTCLLYTSDAADE